MCCGRHKSQRQSLATTVGQWLTEEEPTDAVCVLILSARLSGRGTGWMGSAVFPGPRPSHIQFLCHSLDRPDCVVQQTDFLSGPCDSQALGFTPL